MPKISFRTAINYENGEIEIIASQAGKNLSKHYCKTKEKVVRDALIALGWTPPMSDEIPPEKSSIELECEIILNELTGYTNKSPESISRDLERGILACDPAPRLTGTPPRDPLNVAIPFSVKDALSEAISGNKLPLHPELVSWMEEEVAKYNSVPADTIAAQHHTINTGKEWSFYPEAAAILTGFRYYPPDNP